MAAETFSPRWCPHVAGTFERAVDEDGRPETIAVHLTCATCGDVSQATCSSGAPRQWVIRYASVHVHRDPLDRSKEPK